MQITSKRPSSLSIPADRRIVQGNLTESEKITVKLSIPNEGSLKLREADLLSLALKISSIVKLRLGYKAKDVREEEVFVQILEADCNKFPNLTEGEVLKALEMGIDGYFNPDKDIFFTSSLFVKWLRAYQALRIPALEKYGQLLHQSKDPEVIVNREDRIKTAAKIANVYAATRRTNPEHRVDGGGALFENLQELGLFTIPDKEKQDIFSNVKKANPKDTAEKIKAKCQNIAYDRFIGMLVELECMVSESGEIIKLSDHE